MAETSTVVIVNGVFVNGYVPFEPVYYFKPISGWGSVVRQYPGPFTAYLADSNKVVRLYFILFYFIIFVGLVLLCLLRRSNALLCRYVFRFDEWMMEQAGLGGREAESRYELLGDMVFLTPLGVL